MRTVDSFSMADPKTAADPYRYYAAMRAEDPVHLDPGTGFYWISRYETVARLAADADALSSQSRILLKKMYRPRAQALWESAGMETIDTLVTGDPPDHPHYRALALSLFTPAKVADMKPLIEAKVNELINDLGGEEAEFIDRFAARLPASIVCDQFGFPQEDIPRFKSWTDSVVLLQDPGISDDREVELVARMIELFKYLTAHLRRQDGVRSGRIIEGLATGTRRDGSEFSALERSWMLLFIFGGSNETTINMLASGIRRAATDPELQSTLRQDSSLISKFIDELLRMDGSVQSLLRVATRELTVDGTVIPKGANVMLCVSSANRDSLRWVDPDTFRLDRPDGRRQLSFGQGPHSCVGMHLARRILSTAFETIFRRLSHIELSIPDHEIEQLPLPFHRAIAKLPIRFTRVMG